MKAGIAKLWKPVVNVYDLAEGERFWSALSGLSPHGRHGTPPVTSTQSSTVRTSRTANNGCSSSWFLLRAGLARIGAEVTIHRSS